MNENETGPLQQVLLEKVADLSDGNPGAINAMMACMTQSDIAAPFIIEGAGLRGAAIWITYKDYANYDCDKMLDGIKNRDEALKTTLDIEGYPVDW